MAINIQSKFYLRKFELWNYMMFLLLAADQ